MNRLTALKVSFSLGEILSLCGNKIRQYQKHIASFFALFGIFLFFIFLYYSFEFYIRNYRIPLTDLRKIVIQTINLELGRAVDIGVLDFSLREGLILEDLVISQEEDFSFNEHLLKVKKVTFRLSGFWKSSPNIERIDFYSPQIVADTDSKVRSQLLEYLQSSKVKDIRFHDFRLTLKTKDSTVVNWKEGWNLEFLRKDGKINITYDNGWFWIPNTTRVKGEGFFPESEMEEFSFFIKWKNFPSEEATELTNFLFGSPVHTAVLTGEAKIEKFPSKNFAVIGNVEFENSLIHLPFFSNYMLDRFRFSEKFSFDEKKEERIFSSYDFSIKYTTETFLAKEPLVSRNVEFNVNTLSEITDHIFTPGGELGFPLEGNLKGNLSLTETGERTKWFKWEGGVTGENLKWDSNFFQMDEGSFTLNISKNNHLEFTGKFNVFDKPNLVSLASDLDWTKSKKTDGSLYYPLNSKTKANIESSSIVASDWFRLYNDWQKDTMDEIKERQEKLIPEEYFYQKKVYKYFLESMNWDLNFHFSKFFPYEGGSDLGETKGNLSVKDGRMSLNFPLGNLGSKVSMVSYFASKTPNFTFSLYLNSYPWNNSWLSLCGEELKPSLVDLDYSFASLGSDYYMLHKDARINYFVKLHQVSLKNAEVFTKLPIPIQKFKEPFSIEFNLDHYFETDYLRNLAIYGNELDLKGYGSNKTGNFVYTLYGILGEVRGNWNISEEENRCVIK